MVRTKAREEKPWVESSDVSGLHCEVELVLEESYSGLSTIKLKGRPQKNQTGPQ